MWLLARKPVPHPHPFLPKPGVSGLCLLTLEKRNHVQNLMDQWSQVFYQVLNTVVKGMY